MNTEKSPKRLLVIDALRGFAIVSIMLLHNIEHFDIYYFEQSLPAWMVSLDKIIWDSLFFLFGGKSYAIFALLFGFTYYIQTNNQNEKGNDFRLRFIWRMFLLFLFGIINSAFFQGDILTIYAALGVLLIPVTKLKTKTIFIIAILLFIQPLEIFNLFKALQSPDKVLSDPVSWTYFGRMFEYIGDSSFINTITGNLLNGKKAVLLWNWENGRFFHILSLFMFGFIAGRKKWFEVSEENKLFWKKTLLISTIVFIPMYFLHLYTGELITSQAIRRPFEVIQSSWKNISFMLIIVSSFYLLFNSTKFHTTLNVFSPIGKMSLSNYIFQSIIGSFIYYGFGLSLYKYTGATYGLFIGLSLSALFFFGCKWWDNRFRHGPLESIWHELTWLRKKG